MKINKSIFSWKRTQGILGDVAKISSQEINRGINEAKKQLGKMHFLKKRKELFAELGRTLYDAYEDGLPKEVAMLFKDTELQDIMSEIKEIDNKISNFTQDSPKQDASNE